MGRGRTAHPESHQKCIFYENSFKCKEKLKIHMMRHSVKKFICDDCGNQFMIKGKLGERVKRMQSTSGARPKKFTCDDWENTSWWSMWRDCTECPEPTPKCNLCKSSFTCRDTVNIQMKRHFKVKTSLGSMRREFTAHHGGFSSDLDRGSYGVEKTQKWLYGANFDCFVTVLP